MSYFSDMVIIIILELVIFVLWLVSWWPVFMCSSDGMFQIADILLQTIFLQVGTWVEG